jgi:serpin B
MHRSVVSRRRFLSLSGLAAAGGLLARSPLARACPMHEDIGPAARLANGINTFASEMYAKLSRENTGDLFFSPFSIEAALGMTAAGAKGDTLKEMETVLRLPPEPHAAFGDLINHMNAPNFWRMKRPYQLSVANAIWAQEGYPWHKEFVDLTRKHYGAGVVEVNFGESEAARKRINKWVETETRDKIKDLIGPNVISSLTRMVLANAIYFKGDWQTKFDKKETKDAPFTRADGTKADAPLMNLTSEFNYGEMTIPAAEERDTLPPDVPRVPIAYFRPKVKVQVLELPYVTGQLSMLVYLPDRAAAIDRLAGWLAAEELGTRALKPRKVMVSLPRFKAESKFLLNAPLMEMGMRKAFGAADFTGMSSEGKNLYISHVLHKAFVDVNEEGSEAAAATAVVIKERVSAHPDLPVEFRADRPFAFTIRDNKTGATLFMGRYNGPKA